MEGPCRTCLGQGTPLQALFRPEGQLRHMLTCCTGLVMQEGDGLPEGVCVNCSEEVQRSFSFRNCATSADAQLRKVLLAPTVVDSDGDESVVLFVNTDDSSVSNDCSSFFNKQKDLSNASDAKSISGSDNNTENVRKSPRIKRSPLTLHTKTRKKKISSHHNNLRIVAIKKHLLSKSSEVVGNDYQAENSLQDDSVARTLMKDGCHFSENETEPNEAIPKHEEKRGRLKASAAYGCRKCDRYFMSWAELAHHNARHPPTTKANRLRCRHCSQVFVHQRHINPHIRRDHSTLARFQCGYCGQRWSSLRDLREHISLHTSDSPDTFPFKDDEIESPPENQYLVDNNIISNNDNSVKREELLIDKVSPGSEDDNHISNVPIDHRNKMADTLICYACRQLFIDLESLQAHLIEAHMMEEETPKSDSASGDYMGNVQRQAPSLSCPEVFMSEASSVTHRLQEHGQIITVTSTADISSDNISYQYEVPRECTGDEVNSLNRREHTDIHNEEVIDSDTYNCETMNTHKNVANINMDVNMHLNSENISNSEQPEQKKNQLNKIEINVNSKSRLACDICGKTFRTPSALERHKTSHDPDKPHHCQFGRCKWSFGTEHELAVHVNVNHSGSTHECSFCRKRFPQARNLRQHMRQHQPDKRFHCQHCNKGFNHLHHLQNHERVHTQDLPFLCQECGRAFATRDRLTFHMRRHSDVRPFSCDECGKRFVSMTDVKAHMKTHSGERPHMCSACGKTFSARHSLNKHVRSQHGSSGATGDPGSCGLCGETPTSVQALNQHMKTHTCQYYCPLCQKGFPLTSALEAHIKTHSMGDRSHVCSDCGAAFNRAEHLRGHIARRHSSVRPLACSQCPRTFPRAPDLAAHVRTHSGEKPYVCTDCGRGFTQSGGLRVHSRLHSGERPYICGACHRAHRSAGALAAHMRTHCTPSDASEQILKFENPLALETSHEKNDLQSNDSSSILTALEIQPPHTVGLQDIRSLQNGNTVITNSEAQRSMEKDSIQLEQLVASNNLIRIIQTVNEDGQIVYEREEDRQFDIHEGIE